MKLLFIRHAEPDYVQDSLTSKGWRETKYLAEELEKINISEIYVSPYGRALDTAKETLHKLNRNAIECDWLQEFGNPPLRFRGTGYKVWNAWDKLPRQWGKDERFFRYDEWYTNEVYSQHGVREEYIKVTNSFDELLKSKGYCRDDHFYKVVNGNENTLVFFCHFGIICVLLSHLLNVSPMVLWHGISLAPASITEVVTEERQAGTATFRITKLADVSFLIKNGEFPSFVGRGRECC